MARSIEQETAKMPSNTFLWAAVGSMGLSLAFELAGKDDKSRFVGPRVAPLRIMGLYNKIVKVAGSDRVQNQDRATRPAKARRPPFRPKGRPPSSFRPVCSRAVAG